MVHNHSSVFCPRACVLVSRSNKSVAPHHAQLEQVRQAAVHALRERNEQIFNSSSRSSCGCFMNERGSILLVDIRALFPPSRRSISCAGHQPDRDGDGGNRDAAETILRGLPTAPQGEGVQLQVLLHDEADSDAGELLQEALYTWAL